jgi:SnoaL-like domain
MSDLEQRLEELTARMQRFEDIEAIKQLKARYAECADRGQNLLDLCTDDIVWDGGERFGRHAGKAALREFAVKNAKVITWTLHYMVPSVIDIAEDGRSARGSWYLWELATMPNNETGKSEAVWIGGTYEDTFVKENGRWKFKTVTLRLDVLSPYADGWVKTRFRT